MADRFDLTDGTPLTFADCFLAPEQAQAMILEEIARQGADHPEYDQAALKDAFRREQFYLTADGPVFFYQPGDLNPQAATMPEFLVPNGLLKGMVTPWN